MLKCVIIVKEHLHIVIVILGARFH